MSAFSRYASEKAVKEARSRSLARDLFHVVRSGGVSAPSQWRRKFEAELMPGWTRSFTISTVELETVLKLRELTLLECWA